MNVANAHIVHQTPAESQHASCHGSGSNHQSAQATVPPPINSPTVPHLTNVKTTEIQGSEQKNPTKNKMTFASLPLLETTTDDITLTTCPVFSRNVVDPHSVQRMVVDLIVKTSDPTLLQQTSIHLRIFSGRSQHPSSEPDFDTWRASVDFLLNDLFIYDLQRKRKILDSLLPPAANIVKYVYPPALPIVYVELLESVYCSAEDGDELLAKLMGTPQNQSEKPSDYLHCLQVILSAAIRQGGIAMRHFLRNRMRNSLLKQFWDNRLIADVWLEKRRLNFC